MRCKRFLLGTKGDKAQMSGNRRSSGSSTECLALALLGIAFMPLVGLYMIVKGSGNEKGVGVLLTIVGLAIWIALSIRYAT